MTLAISTSSPLISVSVFEGDTVKFAKREMARQNASELVAKWTVEAVPDFSVVKRLVVDIGPGGFTGVKVGVTMAQMFAMYSEIELVAITAFDLISPTTTVAIPYKRGSYCIREFEQSPRVCSELSEMNICGYGIDGIPDTYPTFNLETINSYGYSVALANLLPLYVAEPSISIPRQPFVST